MECRVGKPIFTFFFAIFGVILIKYYSAFQINHPPPLDPGGGMAAICHTAARGGWAFECPFVRLGVGLARLCHATSRGGWGFWMELMVWGWGWENLSGWGWGGCLRKGGGGGGFGPQDPIVTISISNAHPQSPYPLPQSPMSPNAHSQSKYPQILRAV